MVATVVFQPEHRPAIVEPLVGNVAENDVLIDEDAVGHCEIPLHVNIIGIGQLPWLFDDLAVDLALDRPRILRLFSPAGKLTQPG